ncbi:hypothetical protein J7J90_00805 [Candidatus Micrarchaeota archaeon]|nr:hypothetical protein [Candidatus Micrarchaeota archaeon]
MNINLRITGELERFINELVERGLAANKTEAIRLSIVRYYEETKSNKLSNEKEGWLKLSESSLKKVWDNKKDDEVWTNY